MIVIPRDTIVVCVGTKCDCQCHMYLLLWQSHFFECKRIGYTKEGFWRYRPKGAAEIVIYLIQNKQKKLNEFFGTKEVSLQKIWTVL